MSNTQPPVIVLCLTLTYGRPPRLLNDSVAMFLGQTIHQDPRVSAHQLILDDLGTVYNRNTTDAEPVDTPYEHRKGVHVFRRTERLPDIVS
jgi:hypothetical protein